MVELNALTVSLAMLRKKIISVFHNSWNRAIFGKGCLQKKIAQKEKLVHSHFPPSFPSLNGTIGIGTQKTVY